MKRFIVMRKYPPGFEGLRGHWFMLDSAIAPPRLSFALDGEGAVIFGPTGRFEEREDGERAEVFEPCEPST